MDRKSFNFEALFTSTFFSFPHDCLALTGQTIAATEGLERFGKKLVSYCWCNKIPQSESFKQLRDKMKDNGALWQDSSAISPCLQIFTF